MKASSATSARATPAPRDTGRSSGRPRPTRTTAKPFALAGPSHPPDPAFHAYRKDLADVALAGKVIASHYAEAIERVVTAQAALRCEPSEDSRVAHELIGGEPFLMLDDTLGWAWGYAGKDRRVGYVRSEAISPKGD